MRSVGEIFRAIAQRIQQRSREQPSALAIPLDHTDLSEEAAQPFKRDEHYFQVRVNELYLRSSRKWFSEIDPLVFVVSEFTYDGQARTVPAIVGPALVEKHGQPAPGGTLVRNTRVAGLHPYRGGRVCLTVVLCETERHNHARALIKVIEGVTSTLDQATLLSPHLKVAGAVLDGIEAVLGVGKTEPLAALRTELDVDANDRVRPGYYALIDTPGIEASALWVKQGELWHGTSGATAKRLRDADYVLYSLIRPEQGLRSDLELLPFHPLWKRVQSEATKATEEHYKSARANMLSLYETLVLSPDLTQNQALALADEYAATMEELHQRAVRFALRDAGAAPDSESALLDDARRRALAALGL